MAEPYRWGGVTPESVKELQKRRRWRASSLYARVKAGRLDALMKNPPAGWVQVWDEFGQLVDVRPAASRPASTCPADPASGVSLSPGKAGADPRPTPVQGCPA